MNKTVFPVAMTILFIITFAIAMHDWTLGICMGICMGVAFGMFGSQDDESQDEER